jgi:3D (Asp-Asp-Asp) domain-containing protein
VATPTVVISATGYDKDGTNIRISALPWSDIKLQIAGTPVIDLGRMSRDYKVKGVGSTAYTVLMEYIDYDNAGATRTNTSNTLTVVNLGAYDPSLIPVMANNGLIKVLTFSGDDTLDIPYQVKVSDTADAIILEMKQTGSELFYVDVLADTGTVGTWKEINTISGFKLIDPSAPLYIAADSYLCVTDPVAEVATSTLTVKYILIDDYKKVVK